MLSRRTGAGHRDRHGTWRVRCRPHRVLLRRIRKRARRRAPPIGNDAADRVLRRGRHVRRRADFDRARIALRVDGQCVLRRRRRRWRRRRRRQRNRTAGHAGVIADAELPAELRAEVVVAVDAEVFAIFGLGRPVETAAGEEPVARLPGRAEHQRRLKRKVRCDQRHAAVSRQ